MLSIAFSKLQAVITQSGAGKARNEERDESANGSISELRGTELDFLINKIATQPSIILFVQPPGGVDQIRAQLDSGTSFGPRMVTELGRLRSQAHALILPSGSTQEQGTTSPLVASTVRCCQGLRPEPAD